MRLYHIDRWILPSPFLILQSLVSSKELLVQHATQTVIEAMIGLFSAVIFGSSLAVIMEMSQTLKKVLYPFIMVSQTIPLIALAPLLIIWFGYGLLPKVVLITIACFFPIVINMTDGFAMIDPAWLRLLATMGASNMQIMQLVKLPAALPSFFSGLRIAGTYCVLGAVISEWLGAQSGLGIFLTRSAKSYMTERVFAIIIVISFLSLLVVALIELSARITIPWHYRKKFINQ